jgi:hypothetical protein
MMPAEVPTMSLSCHDCGKDLAPAAAVHREIEVGRSQNRSVFSSSGGAVFAGGSTSHYATVALCMGCDAKRSRPDAEDEDVARLWVPLLVVLALVPLLGLLGVAVWWLCR